MTKFKSKFFPIALLLLILPCTMLLMACKGGDSPLKGDWKLQSITYVQGEEDEDLTVEVGEEVGETTVQEDWLTLAFTSKDVTINLAMEDNALEETLSYQKVNDKYETVGHEVDDESDTVIKFVFTIDGDVLIVEQFVKTGEDGEFELVDNIKHFTVEKGTVDTDTEE